MDGFWIAVIIFASAAAVFLIGAVLLSYAVHSKTYGGRHKRDPLVEQYTPQGLSLELEPVEFKLGKDTLRGALYSPMGKEVKRDKIVVFAHGMWSDHGSYMQEIGYIANSGFLVLGFDYTATSSSDGKSLRGFGQSLKCLDAAVKFVKSREDLKGRKIYVVGHSWGGYAVTNIVKFHPDIAGVVAIAPATEFSAVIKTLLPKRLAMLIPFAELIDFLKTGKYANLDGTKSLEKYKGRVFIIHSKDDNFCNFELTSAKAVKALRGDNYKFYITEGRFHNPHYSTEAIELLKKYHVGLKELPPEKLDEFKKSFDFLKMGELDPYVMDMIIDFLNRDGK